MGWLRRMVRRDRRRRGRIYKMRDTIGKIRTIIISIRIHQPSFNVKDISQRRNARISIWRRRRKCWWLVAEPINQVFIICIIGIVRGKSKYENCEHGCTYPSQKKNRKGCFHGRRRSVLIQGKRRLRSGTNGFPQQRWVPTVLAFRTNGACLSYPQRRSGTKQNDPVASR